MKLITAIVRPEKVNDVLEALYRAEVRGISLSRVQGQAASSTASRPPVPLVLDRRSHWS